MKEIITGKFLITWGYFHQKWAVFHWPKSNDGLLLVIKFKRGERGECERQGKMVSSIFFEKYGFVGIEQKGAW